MVKCLTLNKQPALENRLNIVTVISDGQVSDSKQTTCARATKYNVTLFCIAMSLLHLAEFFCGVFFDTESTF